MPVIDNQKDSWPILRQAFRCGTTNSLKAGSQEYAMAERHPPVNPSQPSTVFDRFLDEHVRPGIEAVEKQHHRKMEVMREFILYKSEFQLYLLEAAIISTLASMANHDRREDCESCFNALVDMMYTSTDDSEKTCNESQRQELYAAARDVLNRLGWSELIGSVCQSSGPQLEKMKEDSLSHIGKPYRLLYQSVATNLSQVLVVYIDHAHPFHLRDLVMECSMLCSLIEGSRCGLDWDAKIVQALSDTFDLGHTIHKAVFKKLEDGKLVVRDGKIVNPQK